MKKVKNTIPVYDICTLKGNNQRSDDIIAERFGTYLQVHPNLHRPHRHSFFHVVLFTKGAGFHTIDFEQFKVAPGEIYFMRPGQVHSWDFSGKTDGYIINFSEQLFERFLADSHYLDSFRFFQGIAADGVLQLDKKIFTEVMVIFEKILEHIHLQDDQGSDLVKTYLIQLFITVTRSVQRNMQPAARPQNQLILHNFRKLVDTHFADKRLPKDYASMLYITPNHLNALSKDMLGKSAGEVIRDRILLEAKRLLVNADINISEIAAQLSFTDSSHFTRFFKKHTGHTPEEFRKLF